MKHITIVANWKSNKTIAESASWMALFAELLAPQKDKLKDVSIIVCSSYTALPILKNEIEKYHVPVALGAQNISPYGQGAYTGEMNGTQIKDVAEYVLIGHSERRKYFAENDVLLESKVQQARSADLRVIYCVPDSNTRIPDGVEIVGYEPVWAIGTGKTDTPENANGVVELIKQHTGIKTAVYGGSVVADNVASFVNTPSIDGGLIGGAGLDPQKFISLIYKAAGLS